MVPESATTFVMEDSNYRVVFVRGADGRASHIRTRECSGVEYNPVRLE